MNQLSNATKHLTEIELLALISAAVVLRKKKQLNELMIQSINNNVPSIKIYEALLQTYLFSGYPSALDSLQIFKKNFPVFKTIKTELRKQSKDGIVTAKKIYGRKFEKLRTNIHSFSPEMSHWFIEEGYGKVLSRKGLSLKERELCIVSVLAALKYNSQLYSHINGAFRLKAGIEIIKKVILNLQYLGKKSLPEFGLDVLNQFKNKKRIE